MYFQGRQRGFPSDYISKSHRGMSIVPQGGNTGLAGGATPNREGNQLIISLKRLNLVRSVDFLIGH